MPFQLVPLPPQFESTATDGTDSEGEKQVKRRRCDTDSISACGIKRRGNSPADQQGGQNSVKISEGERFFNSDSQTTFKRTSIKTWEGKRFFSSTSQSKISVKQVKGKRHPVKHQGSTINA